MLSAALLALTIAAPAAPVPEADAAEAAKLAHRSALEYDLGHAEDALRDIERAYVLDPLPGLLFNLGQCHRKLKHWEQAESAYRGFLHYKPDAPNRATVLALIEDMQREAAAANLPKLFRALPEERRARPSPLPPLEPAPAPPPKPVQEPPPPIVATAPPAAVEVWPPPAPGTPSGDEHATAKSQATAWPWVFGGGALVAAGLSIGGFVQMANYGSLKGQSQTQAVPESAAKGAEAAYAWGEPLGITGAAVAVLCIGGTIWTW